MFRLGLNLALRSGQEQRNLHPDQFSIVEDTVDLHVCDRKHLVYTEFGSKNISGGVLAKGK